MIKCWHGFWPYGICISKYSFWDPKRKKRLLYNIPMHHFLITDVGWINFFLDNLALRSRISILSQKLPKKLEGVLIKYYVDAPKLTRTGKHSFSLVGNMDKIQIFFDLTPWKCISTKDERVCGLFFFMEWKEYIWQFYCQPLEMDKCFHTWSFWGEKLTKLSVI